MPPHACLHGHQSLLPWKPLCIKFTRSATSIEMLLPEPATVLSLKSWIPRHRRSNKAESVVSKMMPRSVATCALDLSRVRVATSYSHVRSELSTPLHVIRGATRHCPGACSRPFPLLAIHAAHPHREWITCTAVMYPGRLHGPMSLAHRRPTVLGTRKAAKAFRLVSDGCEGGGLRTVGCRGRHVDVVRGTLMSVMGRFGIFLLRCRSRRNNETCPTRSL